MLGAYSGRLQPTRTDPTAHGFGVTFSPSSSLGHGEHCCLILQQSESHRTATPAINHGKWRHSAALSEIRAVFLNGARRSVNRKVQGSNPWSGAKSEFKMTTVYGGACRFSAATVEQQCSKSRPPTLIC